MNELPTIYEFYPSDAPKPDKDEESGRLIYQGNYFVKREKIDREGRWRINADSLSGLISEVDHATRSGAFSSWLHMLSIHSEPSYVDGYWQIEIHLGSHDPSAEE